MRTEIVIPFTFDTAPIESMLQNQGKEEALKIIREMVEGNVIKEIPKKRASYYDESKPDWRGLMQDYFYKWLNEHADEIVDEAAMLLAARGMRKKKWREVLEEIKEREA